MMKYSLLITAILLLPLSNLFSQIPESLEMEFQELLVNFQNQSGAIGLSAAVHTANDEWAGTIGMSSGTEALNTDHPFGMGSVSKTIISAVILQMSEQDVLSLDDPIDQYIGDFEYVNANINIRQLLNHTSGLYNYTQHPNFFDDVFNDPTAIISPETILNTYINSPIFEPGFAWSYSNTNYVVLGMIIESVAGQAHYLEARERFDFDNQYPSINMPPFESPTTDLANLWADTSDVGSPQVDLEAVDLSLDALFSGAGAAGAYACVPSDLAKWAYDLYTGVWHSQATVDEILTITPPSFAYGLGAIIGQSPCGYRIYGHTGNIFYTTATFYDSENDIAVSVHSNDSEQGGIVEEVAVQLLCTYAEYLTTSTEEISTSGNSLKAFPNPFADNCQLQYELSAPTMVQFRLFDELGQLLVVQEWAEQTAGIHNIQIPGDLLNGVYWAQVQMGEEQISQKLVKMAP